MADSTKRAPRKRGLRIRPDVEHEVLQPAFVSFGIPQLGYTTRGRFCYVEHDGKPLCRLGYSGGALWEFALYRYSTGSYGNGSYLLPSETSVADGIEIALLTYNLK